MNDLERAIHTLQSEALACVLCKGETAYKSAKRGVLPLVEWAENGVDLRGFSAADKIVGKAAALLFALFGVSAVYSPVMSEAAVAVLARLGINHSYGKTVATVVNRAGTGPCPMEHAVTDVDEPAAALIAIKNTIISLKACLKE